VEATRRAAPVATIANVWVARSIDSLLYRVLATMRAVLVVTIANALGARYTRMRLRQLKLLKHHHLLSDPGGDDRIIFLELSYEACIARRFTKEYGME